MLLAEQSQAGEKRACVLYENAACTCRTNVDFSNRSTCFESTKLGYARVICASRASTFDWQNCAYVSELLARQYPMKTYGTSSLRNANLGSPRVPESTGHPRRGLRVTVRTTSTLATHCRLR